MTRRSPPLVATASALTLALTLAITSCGGGGSGPADSGASSPPAPASAASSPSPSPSPSTYDPPAVPSGKVSMDGCTVPRGGKRVAVEAPDGVTLAGVAFGRGAKGVALFHESDGTLCRWADYAYRLAQRGVLVLAIDSRGHGASPDPAVEAGKQSRYDLDGVAAVSWLRQHGARSIALVGASVGGTLALATAQRPDSRANAVASLSAETQDGALLDALAHPERLPDQVLLVVGKNDPVFAKDQQGLHAAIAGSHALVVPSGSHGTALLNDLVAGQPVSKVLTDFLLVALR